MRYGFAVLVLGATLALTASAALAGGNFDYTDRYVQSAPAVTSVSETPVAVTTGSSVHQSRSLEFRGENIVR